MLIYIGPLSDEQFEMNTRHFGKLRLSKGYFITESLEKGNAPVIPEKINQLLGSIRPRMSEAQLQKLVKKHFPEAKAAHGIWSGQTGYVDFVLNDRFNISISEFNNPKDAASRFVHEDMRFYVFDNATKRRTDISFLNLEGKAAKPQPLPKPLPECPKGSRQFSGPLGPGCCKDGAACD